jgi:hypothetical protein
MTEHLNLDDYPFPEMSGLTLDECETLYRISGVVQEDFTPAPPSADAAVHAARTQQLVDIVRNPRFRRGLLHIAVQRAHPDLDQAELEKLVGTARGVDVASWFWDGDGDPPTVSSQNEPEKQPSSGEPSRRSGSGSSSRSDSDAPASPLAATGASA